MTKAVEVITSVQRRPALVAGGEGADCCSDAGAGRKRLRGRPRGWDIGSPGVGERI
jgi:hypothetical protein